MTPTQLLPRKETNMDPDRLVAYGIGILGIISTAFGIYWTFRKNAAAERAEEQDRKAKEHDRQIEYLYAMQDRQQKKHDEDIAHVEEKLDKCQEREEQSKQRELVSNALATRQDDKIVNLTGQVKNLTESLLAAGIDRRGRDVPGV